MSQLIDRRQNAGKKARLIANVFYAAIKAKLKKQFLRLSENGVSLKLIKANKLPYQLKTFMNLNSIGAMEAISNVYYREMIISSPEIG